MKIRIVAVGKLRERHWQDAVSDYTRRLQSYCRLEIAEVPERRIADSASPAEESRIMELEGTDILALIQKRPGKVVALDRQGQAYDSSGLAEWLREQIIQGQNEITWVIGGPLGLSPPVLERADLVLSISRLTFPHQMVRPILLEQIYRAFRIIHHQPYHK